MEDGPGGGGSGNLNSSVTKEKRALFLKRDVMKGDQYFVSIKCPA